MIRYTREKGRAIIAEIRVRNGGISAEDRRNTPATVLESFDNRGRQLGKQLIGLVDDLYSKDTRFAFELIQNAEDNHYNLAGEEGEDPFLNFALYPDSIVVDSNEDGFQLKDVDAICSARDSTKTSSEGYIGEKGIGFKSLFRIASRVQIQSGCFSFSFQHQRGDDGMGLITPLDEAYHDLPRNVRTRMTLTLSNSSEARELVRDFSNPLSTVLLFLNKLKRITVSRFDAAGLVCTDSLWYEYNPTTHRGILHARNALSNGSLPTESHTYYHIARRKLEDLPEDERRTYKIKDKVFHVKRAEVVLAFPLDAQSTPLIGSQDVFAFLPMRDVGFKFLIQSDFITVMNRQDIAENKWNAALLDGIAHTFRDAVIQLCQHPTLQFQWVRYLPTNDISEKFWAQVLPKIVTLLKASSILRPWSGSALKQPHQLKWLLADNRDSLGDPLFQDLPSPGEVYLSWHYAWNDKPALDQLGVQVIHWNELFTRMQADLESPNSKFKSPTTSIEWHTRVAQLLTRALDLNLAWLSTKVRALRFIPLQAGSWVPAIDGAVFYPDNAGVPVPTDLGIQLVDRRALANPSRRALLSKLGTRECAPKQIIAKIISRYRRNEDISLEYSVMHLRYLYWHLPGDALTLDNIVHIRDHRNVPVYHYAVTDGRKQVVDDLYFESGDEYGVQHLLSKVTVDDIIVAPGHPVHFIHHAYLSAVPKDSCRSSISWEGWLQLYANVQRTPQLFKSSGTVLSDVCLYIAQYRNDKLIGTLREYWDFYGAVMKPEIRQALTKIKVACRGPVDKPLEEAYMPLQKLERLSRELDVEEQFPFLKIDDYFDLVDGTLQEWDFLKSLNVRHKSNLDFYLDVLQHFRCKHRQLDRGLCPNSSKILFTIYEAIEQHSKAAAIGNIREVFRKEEAIYVVPKGDEGPCWVSPQECVWKSPGFVNYVHPLADASGYRDNEKLKNLFQNILEIKDTTYSHYVEQIKSMRGGRPSLAAVSDIYRHICMDASTKADWEIVRGEFQKHSLICVYPQIEWHPPSSCLWTDNSRIAQMFAIASYYEDLRDLFVRKLCVQKPDLRTFVSELVRIADSNEAPPMQKVKELIRDVNAWGPDRTALVDLMECDILPIKASDGHVSLGSRVDVFAIVDRRQYGDLFKARVPVLDFAFEDIHDLEPFISALSLQDRYMSHSIREVSDACDASIDRRLTRHMQEKAYALYRCAVHYNAVSADSRSLYHQLLASEVYKSAGITKSITISICDTDTTIEGASGNLHISSDNTQLRFYVPRHEQERELCYLYQIPGKLLAHLNITNVAASKVIGDIVKATCSAVTDRLLDEHGIVRVQGIEPMPPPAEPFVMASVEHPDIEISRPTYQPARSSASTPLRGPNVSDTARTPSPSPSSRARSSVDRSLSATPTTYSYSRSLDTPRSSISPGSTRERVVPRLEPRSSTSPTPSGPRRRSRSTQENDLSEYRDLLDRVISAASRYEISAFEANVPVTVPDPNPLTLSDAVFGKRSENQMSHDVRIGAAGELFVFELLLRMGLPGFTRRNWASTVRKKVRIHDKYKNMEPWNGAETADIVYQDGCINEDGVPEYQLSSFLEEKGYLSEGSVRRYGQIKYFLEVKTTTKECESRFFMSRAQYQRMHCMRLGAATEVYIVMRVFNLGQDNIGVRLYVDPGTMERNGMLNFEPASYIVTPPKPVSAAPATGEDTSPEL